jgi:hypothetical protein
MWRSSATSNEGSFCDDLLLCAFEQKRGFQSLLVILELIVQSKKEPNQFGSLQNASEEFTLIDHSIEETIVQLITALVEACR